MLLHLSDLHFGTEKPACLKALQRFCAEHQPEAIAVSGDLTQRARFQQFYACRKFLDSLQVPYLAVPGNHDIPLYNLWNRMFSPFSRYKLFFGDMESRLETEHYCIFGVNSIRRRYHTRGHISLEQIAAVDSALQQAPAGKLKLIAVHQPFYTPPDSARGVKDCPVMGRMALQSWSRHGLNGLLHGHLHHAAVFDLNAIYALQAGHPVWEIHAGTAVSSRLHHGLPNGFNLIDTDGAVSHYIFSETEQRFYLKASAA